MGFHGTSVPGALRRYVAEGAPAGAVLFGRNIESTGQVAELLRELRGLWPAEGPTPLLAVDQEGGAVRRLKSPQVPEFIPLPTARQVAASGDMETTREAGRLTAMQLAALGFNMNFAPVLDVDSNPNNPVIGARSFGSTPTVVAQHGRAFVEGSLDGGVLPCIKHFPGHGDTDTDSHLALPRLHHPRERLEAIELAPFREAMGWHISAIMTAHVVFSALDDQWPATLSDRVLPTLLRTEMGYDGVVISDDLEMKAIADHHDPDTVARRGLDATVDLFLVCEHLDLAAAIRDGLRAAEGSSHARARQVKEARRRVLALRKQAHDHAAQPYGGTLPGVAEAEALVARLTA